MDLHVRLLPYSRKASQKPALLSRCVHLRLAPKKIYHCGHHAHGAQVLGVIIVAPFSCCISTKVQKLVEYCNHEAPPFVCRPVGGPG